MRALESNIRMAGMVGSSVDCLEHTICRAIQELEVL